ncbi:hypothetical protein SPBR_06911 [Sporothrix brasiliensis 5110]|uniref:Uncharacterized protein n=1 Tax=Sporothrix brasiliensis 5110 TaxID=1398154 RepID=A0A0C2IQH3_9PEZI|nr:uncharacterized protein SPBR_06911 [Sporothrix brasiliensis 5110]KIH89130.1 hypothetical protein SPBR_06911 [Sporothrix brasiliensis 5110]
MPFEQTITIINNSGKIISTPPLYLCRVAQYVRLWGKHLVGIFKEARSAYKEKKETLRQERHSGIRRARTFDLSRSEGYHGPLCEVEEYDDAHHYDQREGYYHNHRSLGQAAPPLYLEDGGHSRRLSLDGGDRRSHYSLNNRQPRRSQRSSTGSGTSVNGARSSFRPHQPPLTAHNLRDLSQACDGHSQASDSRRNSHGLYAKTSAHNLVPLRSALNDIPPMSVTHTAALPQGRSNSPAVALSSPRASILVHRPRSDSALSRLPKDSGNVPPPKLIDTNLAYGNIPPDLESRIDLDPEAFIVDKADELKESYATTLVDRIETLLNEAQCIHHTAASIIRHLQDKPEAAAAVALTLAELSALLTRLSPAYLGVVKGGSPAVFALLASPQFLIGTSIVVGATVILFGGWKIVKRISEVRAAREEGRQTFATGDQSGGFPQQHAPGIDSEIVLGTAEEPLSALQSSSRGYEEALVLEEELCTIETWRRGIEPILDGGSGIKPWEASEVDLELISPKAMRSCIGDDDQRTLKSARTAKSLGHMSTRNTRYYHRHRQTHHQNSIRSSEQVTGTDDSPDKRQSRILALATVTKKAVSRRDLRQAAATGTVGAHARMVAEY